MTTRTRATIFWLFAFLFVVGGSGLIFYVSGYRLNLETGKVEKVGGAFIKTNLSSYTVTLEGKHFKEMYPVTNQLFIPSLTPGNYTFSIDKSGYRSWKKQFTVFPRLVTSFKSTLLIPNPLAPELLLQASSTETFSASKNASLLLTPNTHLGTLTLYNLSTGDIVKTIKEKSAEDITWLSDNTSFFYKNSTTGKIVFVSGEKTINVTTTFARSLPHTIPASKSIITHLYPHPFEKKLIVQTNKSGVFIFDPLSSESLLLTDTNPVAVALDGSNLFFLDTTGQLFSENLITKNVNTLVFKPLPLIASSSQDRWNILMSPDEKTFALFNETSGDLFVGSKESGQFSLIDTHASSPLFAYDSRKLTYVKEKAPVIYWLLKDEELRKKEGQKDTLSIELPITKLVWYEDNAHLFGYTDKKDLYFFETDNRSPLETLLVKNNVADYFYHQGSNSLFYLNDASLLKLDFNFPIK
ncbi:MAG: hypothetical protein HZA35_03820 [Parcubacteria group bacterium]|nr:hypothetical protein [Parcubacteria group bacterium]